MKLRKEMRRKGGQGDAEDKQWRGKDRKPEIGEEGERKS